MTKRAKYIRIFNVKLRYPSLFEPKVWEPNPDFEKQTKPKYETYFVLDPVENKEDIEKIYNEIDTICRDVGVTRKYILAGTKNILKDGEESKTVTDDIKGKIILKGSNANKIYLQTQDGKQATDADQHLFKGGSFVNACIELSYFKSKQNERIVVRLHCVQFCKEGDSFISQPANFEDVSFGDTLQWDNPDIPF